VAGAAVGAGVIDHLLQGGFTDASSQSARAESFLVARFHNDIPDLELVVSSSANSLDDPAVVAAGKALDTRLSKEPGVGNVLSYWATCSGWPATHPVLVPVSAVRHGARGDAGRLSRLARSLRSVPVCRYRSSSGSRSPC
jgi:hypothetical protein